MVQRYSSYEEDSSFLGDCLLPRPRSWQENIRNIPRALLRRFVLHFRLFALILIWFATGIGNTFIAKILLSEPHNISEDTLTLTQLIFCSFTGFAILRWLRLHPYQPLSKEQTKPVLVLGSFFLAKNLLAFASMSRVPISIVNTIRGSSPIFTVFLSYLFLNQKESVTTVVSLLPITVGVTLASVAELSAASANEVSDCITGLVAALLTTLLTVSQNILSKRMYDEHFLDSVNLQYYLSISALVYLGPYYFLFSGGWRHVFLMEDSIFVRYEHSYDSLSLLALVLVNGLCNFLQSQVALNVLSRLTPLSYTVTSTMKRISITVLSIIFFRNPVSWLNACGIVTALSGVALYNLLKIRSKGVTKSHLVVTGTPGGEVTWKPRTTLTRKMTEDNVLIV
eukprot:Rmarinus@m.19989